MGSKYCKMIPPEIISSYTVEINSNTYYLFKNNLYFIKNYAFVESEAFKDNIYIHRGYSTYIAIVQFRNSNE